MLSKKDEFKREYTDYNFKENAIKWLHEGFKSNTGAGDGIYANNQMCTIVYHPEISAIEGCLDIILEKNKEL